MQNSKLYKVGFSTLLLIILATVFQSCDSNITYTESASVHAEGWSKDTAFVFTPIINEVDETYNVFIWVRHSKKYKYNNIWLKVLSEISFGNDSTHLVEIPIADKTGLWLGDCTQSMCTKKLLLKEDVSFNQATAFKVEVMQYMREDVLKDVKNVGLEVELSNSAEN